MPDFDTFILGHTHIVAPPLIPEIRLHLAEKSLPIWQETEEYFGTVNSFPPFWAFAWAGGQALARYLLDRPELARGKAVLDLGSGSGLVGIAAAKSGARSVLAADIDPLAVAVIKLNALVNNVEISATAQDLLSAEPPADLNLIVVGDLFYERALADRVLQFIQRAKAQGAEILIGDPIRTYFPADTFEQLAVYQVMGTLELEDSAVKATTVWRFAPKP